MQQSMEVKVARIFRSPSQYVQGAGELSRIRDYISALGNNILFVTSPGGEKRFRAFIESALEGADTACFFEKLSGECSRSATEKLVHIANDCRCNVIAGVGGGKVLDTAKAVSHFTGHPLIIVPTSASTDAPCSALSVLYHEDGVFDQYLFLKTSPNIILVDSEIIINAPVRLLTAGMGDALATYFEARAVQRSGKKNQVGGFPSVAAYALAERSYEVLRSDGLKAKLDAERHCCSKAVENIIEVNIYLSGVGFESGGLAAAHACQKGLTLIPELHSVYHGEKVAFCTLVQLALENAPTEEIRDVIGFCRSVGLPTTFAELGITRDDPELFMRVAEKTCAAGATIYNMPFAVEAKDVFYAMYSADALGKAF
jgi:glycerol dehydrogenase